MRVQIPSIPQYMGYAQMGSDTLAINYAYVRHNGPVRIRNIPQTYAGLSQYIGDCSCPVQAGLTNRKYIA